MISKISFLISESLRGLYRSKVPALISSITIAISLVILSVAIFSYHNFIGLTKNINSSNLNISDGIKTVLVPKDMDVNLKNIKAEIIKLDSINNLEEKLKEVIKPGDTVLFSCGGSSFNDFKNYKERGIFFKKIVSNLKEDNA